MTGFAEDLDDIGGRLSWYGLPFAWLLRITLGNLFGEDLRLGRPDAVTSGAQVDWWTVVVREDEALVLRSYEWFCGEAWLGFRVAPDGPPAIEQVGLAPHQGRARHGLLVGAVAHPPGRLPGHGPAPTGRVRRGARSLRRRGSVRRHRT